MSQSYIAVIAGTLLKIVALDFGGLFAGAIVTETIFTLDGMGYYFINSLRIRLS
jgi:ABC-type dipeptide/oligopeptide/nickel transport system permease component